MPSVAEELIKERKIKQQIAQEAYDAEVLKSILGQKKIQTVYETMLKDGSADPSKFLSTMASSEKAAHAAAQAKHELNNAKAEVAHGEYLKEREGLDAQKNTLEQQGKFTAEMRKEYEQKCEAAYQKYVDTKKQLDKDSEAGWNAYKEFCQDNRKKYDALINPDDTMSLSAPSQTQTSPTVVTPLPSAPKKDVSVVSALNDEIMKKFQETFKDNQWYKDNPPKKGDDGKLSLAFKSDEDMHTFFEKLAKENKNFIIVDGKTNEVMGYAKDGKLCHANGDEFKKGDALKPGGTKLDSFKMPEPQPETTQSNTL